MAMDRADVAALPSLAGLKGLTIRNTFLEFEEFGKDDWLEDGMFQRQLSEPAKLWNRQVSEQTTACSGASAEGATEDTEGEDPTFRARCFMSGLAPSLQAIEQPTAPAGNPMVGFANVPQLSAVNNGATKVPALSPSLWLAAPPSPSPPQAVTGQPFGYQRFCPSCGTEFEMSHAFCTCCGFQLQPFSSWLPCGASARPMGPAAPVAALPPLAHAPNTPQQQVPWCASPSSLRPNQFATASTAAAAPHLLSCLSRFRYVELGNADVGMAYLMLSNMKRFGSAA